MKVVEESRLCGGTDFGVHIHLIAIIMYLIDTY